MPRNCVTKKRHLYRLFLAFHSQIWRYCFEISFLCCFGVAYNIYYVVLDNSKFLLFTSIYFLKLKLNVFWGQNRKIWKIQDCKIVACSNLRLLRLLRLIRRLMIVFYFKLSHSRSLQTFAAFWPKSRKMTSLKRHFLKNLSTDFSGILSDDAKLIAHQVLKVLRRYLLSFLGYLENREGG